MLILEKIKQWYKSQLDGSWHKIGDLQGSISFKPGIIAKISPFIVLLILIGIGSEILKSCKAPITLYTCIVFVPTIFPFYLITASFKNKITLTEQSISVRSVFHSWELNWGQITSWKIFHYPGRSNFYLFLSIDGKEYRIHALTQYGARNHAKWIHKWIVKYIRKK